MATRSAALKKLNPDHGLIEYNKKRLEQATKALSSSTRSIANDTRLRHFESGKTAKLPSRKQSLVEKNDIKKEKSFIGIMRLFALAVVFSLVAVVGIQTIIASKQIKINEIRENQKNEIIQYRKIRKDIATLKSPDRINRRAAFLGLIQPNKFTTINIPFKTELRSDINKDQLNSELKVILNGS